jgi:hypothetical protein
VGPDTVHRHRIPCTHLVERGIEALVCISHCFECRRLCGRFL